MLRYLFVLFLWFYAIIHLLGFLSGYSVYDTLESLRSIERDTSLFWLLSSVIFMGAGISYLWGVRRWWMIALCGAFLSEILILSGDGPIGLFTAANILIFAVCFLSWSGWRFNRDSHRLSDVLRIQAKNASFRGAKNKIASLPDPVRRWIDWTGLEKQPFPESIYLEQRGSLRLKPGASPLPFVAEQWFSLTEPAFLWNARVGDHGLLQFHGRDRFNKGKGSMLIKMYGLIPVVDATGTDIDQGSAVRFLSEIVWFPQMALSDEIRWEGIDHFQARATLKYGKEVSGVFSFREDGSVAAFEAPRIYGETGKMETWHIDIGSENKVFDGIQVPTEAFVTWKLPSSDFTWLELKVRKVKFREHFDR